MKSTNAQQSNSKNKETLDLLGAAHAIVSTFSFKNNSPDVALGFPAIVKMLRGVDVLLTRAQEGDVWGSEPGEAWDAGDTLPESWMFKPVDKNTVNVDMLNTACCRAQALVHVFTIIGDSDDSFDILQGYDFVHGIWAIEGLIAQAIAIVNVGDRCTGGADSDTAIKAELEAA